MKATKLSEYIQQKGSDGDLFAVFQFCFTGQHFSTKGHPEENAY